MKEKSDNQLVNTENYYLKRDKAEYFEYHFDLGLMVEARRFTIRIKILFRTVKI